MSRLPSYGLRDFKYLPKIMGLPSRKIKVGFRPIGRYCRRAEKSPFCLSKLESFAAVALLAKHSIKRVNDS